VEKSHNEELNDLYSSPTLVRVIKSRRLKWAGYVTPMEGGRGVYRVLEGKTVGKRPLGRPGRRWDDNIKIYVQDVGCGVWTGMSRLRIETGGGILRMR
jgi:hypothetical protein